MGNIFRLVHEASERCWKQWASRDCCLLGLSTSSRNWFWNLKWQFRASHRVSLHFETESCPTHSVVAAGRLKLRLTPFLYISIMSFHLCFLRSHYTQTDNTSEGSRSLSVVQVEQLSIDLRMPLLSLWRALMSLKTYLCVCLQWLCMCVKAAECEHA